MFSPLTRYPCLLSLRDYPGQAGRLDLRLISEIYRILITLLGMDIWLNGKLIWEPYFLRIPGKWFGGGLSKLHHVSLIEKNLYKILMLWYHTPSVLHSIYQEVLDRCWSYDSHGVTLSRVFWDCFSIQQSWGQVQQLLYQMVGILIPVSPLAYLLNVPPFRLN